MVLHWVYSSSVLPFLNCGAPKPHTVSQTMSQQAPMQQVAHFCKTWPVPSTFSVTSCWQFRDPTIAQLHPPAFSNYMFLLRGKDILLKYNLTYVNLQFLLLNLTFKNCFNSQGPSTLVAQSSCILIKPLKIHQQFHHPNFKICLSR